MKKNLSFTDYCNNLFNLTSDAMMINKQFILKRMETNLFTVDRPATVLKLNSNDSFR